LRSCVVVYAAALLLILPVRRKAAPQVLVRGGLFIST
jgi:hypothetical protein